MSTPARRSVPPPAPSPAAPVAPADDGSALRRQPRQSRGEQRVARLLDAAAAIIADDGIEAATAEAIALRARTAKGSLYQFFPNRDAVIGALALRYAEELRQIHDRALSREPLALPPERLIDRLVRPLAAFHDRNPAFRRVFAYVDTRRDPPAERDTGAPPPRVGAALLASITDRLDALFAARNPALTARERHRAALLATTIGQAVLARRARATGADRKAMLDDLRRVLVAYLAPILGPGPGTCTD